MKRFATLLATLILALTTTAAYADHLPPPKWRSPANNTTVAPQPTFRWNPVAGADWYLLWVGSPDDTGDNLLFCEYDQRVNPEGCWVQATQYQSRRKLDDGEYSVWIATHQHDDHGDWAFAADITVGSSPEIAWLRVNPQGKVEAQSGGFTVKKGPGRYDITSSLIPNLKQLAPTVSQYGSPRGPLTITYSFPNSRTMRVRILNSRGNAASAGFAINLPTR